MPKILINLSEKEDRITEIFKIVNNLKTKQEAIKLMIEHFEAEVTPTNIKKDKYFKR
jgi:hypothetical protein